MIPPRTTPEQVQAILLDNYDFVTQPALDPFIAMASPWVDRVVSLAASQVKGTFWVLTAQEALNIETALAAHFYCRVDKTYQSKTTQGASANFTGQTGLMLEATEYGQMAIGLDPSGILKNLDKRTIARGYHLGGRRNCGQAPSGLQ